MNTSHERALDGKEEWLTPPNLIMTLGPFDLDPCAPMQRPWDTAKTHYTIEDDGLSKLWNGRVWLNPPYGRKTEVWLKKLAEHGKGTALIYARTDTHMFFEHVWNRADAVLFLQGRLKFYHANGAQGGAAGAPSCLVAYGHSDVCRLAEVRGILKGKFIEL